MERLTALLKASAGSPVHQRKLCLSLCTDALKINGFPMKKNYPLVTLFLFDTVNYQN